VLAFVTLALLTGRLLFNWKRSGRSFGSFIGLGTVRLYARLWHGCTFPAPVALPATGRAIIVVNHTSSPDGCFVQCGSRRGLTFLVAEEFFQPWFLWIWATTACVPVRRSGRDVRALRLGLRRLEEGRTVVVFPEGTLSGAGMGRLRTPKCGAAFLALHGNAPVFPAFISGGPQNPRVGPSWFLPSRKRVRIVYGPALDLTPYRDRPITRPLLEQLTAFFMRQIAALDPARKKRQIAMTNDQ
jgi:1-acyl-sn-glycerol-3-phosphate acyltransferase